ncbi:transferase [Syncephalis plumigaleata]|nr:transferase [Syncephalis plumigaleata]
MTVDTTIEHWLVPSHSNYGQMKYTLSDADDIPGPPTHRLFFYKNHERKENFMPTEKLVDALRKVIDQYPVVAGHQALEVHPSEKGVHYRETHSTYDMSAFEPDWSQSSLPLEWEAISKEDYDHVPCAVHVVRLANNSGIVICQSGSHLISDGTGWTMLLKAWATFARGEIPPPPLIDYQLLRLDSEERHLVKIPNANTGDRAADYAGNTVNHASIIRFNADSLARLKQVAVDSLSEEERRTGGWFSTINVLCVFLWRVMLRVRQVPHDKILANHTISNMRTQLNDIPSHYFGNAIESCGLIMRVGDVLNNSLGTIALKLRQDLTNPAITNARDWIRWANTDGNESLIYRGNRWSVTVDFLTTDWTKFNYYEQMDFGEGNPVCARRLVHPNMAISTLLETPPCSRRGNERSIDVSLITDADTYDKLVADSELLEYATIIG